jgi:hypothetical protein
VSARLAGRARGSTTAEYVGAILAVGLLMLALVAVREHRPERRPPVDPVARIAALVRAPRIAPRPRATPARPRPRPARPRPPRPPRPSVLVPGWAIGW